jgi:CRP-like cAMP-binding protein
MQRFRYVDLNKAGVQTVNCLLSQGWRPVREIASQVAPEPAASLPPAGPVLFVLLERDEEFPLRAGEILADGVSLMDLTKASLFAGLTGDELREIIAAGEVREYDAEATVFAAAGQDPSLYVVLSGRIDVRLPTVDTDEGLLLSAGPFDTLGEGSFFARTPHTADAIAAERSLVLCVTRDAFDELVQAGRPAALKIAVNGAALLGARLQSADAWAAELLQEEQSARIARSWRRFRYRMSSPVDVRGGFFSPAGQG